jgi:hypothetical protein
VVVNAGEASASSPNITWGFDDEEVVEGLPRSVLSDERRTIVQCGFDFPRVGRRKARVSDERGTVASMALEFGFVNLREDL